MKEAITASLVKIQKSARDRATAFVIGNTSRLLNVGKWYEIPARETGELIYGGVIVRDVETAKTVARLVDGKVDYVFVDDEKKIHKMYYGPRDVGNIEKAVRAIVKKSNLIAYKGNDLTVTAVDTLLQGIVPEVGGKIVAIIGMGNLGSKIALSLIERGAHVQGYRRDAKKLTSIVIGLNSIKSPHTLAKVVASKNILSAHRGADIVIGATNERGVITKKMLRVAAPNVVLIDAGMGCFAEDVTTDPNFLVYRVDVSIMQKYIFTGLLNAKNHFSKKLGRRYVKNLGVTLISLGLVGRPGEIIVDDIQNPAQVIGIIAEGGVLERNTPVIQKQIAAVKKYFKIK